MRFVWSVVLVATLGGVTLATKCPEWLSDLTTAAQYWVDNDCANAPSGNTTITSCASTPCQAKCAQALLKWSDEDYRSCTNSDPSLNGTMWGNALKQCRCKGSASKKTVATILVSAALAITLAGVFA